MNVLITGVAGLIGSRMATWIIENIEGAVVVGVDDLSGGYVENVPKGVVFQKLNLVSDYCELDKLFAHYNFTYVYHFAAYAAEGLSPFIRRFNYDNNLKATASIVNLCINYDVTRVVFTSTLAVYGHGDGGIFDEDQIPAPIDPYGVAKYACEMDIRIAGEQHGLDWCIIRPHNVYGIKQNIWDKYRNVLGIWMFQNLSGLPLSVFGDGSQTRAFSYVDDSLKPLWLAAVEPKASKQIINLGGVKETSILEAALLLKDVMGNGARIEFFEPRHEVKHSIPTWQKSADLLGFEHKTDLENGLKAMWIWAKDQPLRERFIWDRYEISKGIYSFWKKE